MPLSPGQAPCSVGGELAAVSASLMHYYALSNWLISDGLYFGKLLYGNLIVDDPDGQHVPPVGL